MKISILTIALLFTFNLHAQIPDSLEVVYPWQIINVPDCQATMGKGPTSKKSGVRIYLESDETQFDASEQCVLRTKNWIIYDSRILTSYTYAQKASVKEFANTNCENQIYFSYQEDDIELTPNDLLLNLDPTHNYSFSATDPDHKSVTVRCTQTKNFELYVYDFTDNTVCKSDVFVTSCEEDAVVVFPETVEIEFNGEPYFILTPEMLGMEVDYPCSPFEIDIRVNMRSSGLLTFDNIGTLATVKIRVDIENEFGYHKEIYVKVTGTKPDPIPMYIEDKSFSAGETIELDIWSTDISGLGSWGLQLQFLDVEVIGIESGDMFGELPHNIMTEESAIRALWYSYDGYPIDAMSNATWFTAIVKPKIDGSTLDIFKTQQDPWSTIGIEVENISVDYEADFLFNIAPRDILDVDDLANQVSIDISPNPATDRINISGMPNSNLITNIKIYDLEGKLMLDKEYTNQKSTILLDISEIPPGMFVLKAQNGKMISTQKILKI